MIVPVEDPVQLEALTAEYYRQFEPSTPLARFLVESLIDAGGSSAASRRMTRVCNFSETQ